MQDRSTPRSHRHPPTPAEAAARAGVRIRAAEPFDVEAMARTMEDPGVYRGTLQVPYTSIERRRQTLTFNDEHVRFLVAVPLEDDDAAGEPIGSISIQRSTRPRRIHTATLGMSVRDAWQGRGVGSALLAAVLDVADNWWQVRRVHLEVYADNEPAIALYRRYGFEEEGRLRQDAFRDGQYVDSLVMARLSG